MDPYLAELSRTMDAAELGKRIRNARIGAGMTQAQVVGGEVSPAYLSRIEDGTRRPEAGLLERMTGRMGITLEELLLDLGPRKVRELRLAVDHAELSLAGGEPKAALEAIDAVLQRLPEAQMPELRRAAMQVRAGALEAVGDLNAAIVVLEDLVATPTADGNWVRGLIALSRCYRDSGNFAEAIAVGERASNIIEELGIEGLTESIQLTVTVAAAYHRQGDLEKAKRLCMRALEAGEKYDSPVAKASAYWNASILETSTNGATPAAVDMARKALALFEVGEDNRNLAKLRAEVANLQLAQDPPDAEAALETLRRAEAELTWSGGSAWEVALVHLTRARAHYLLGDFPAALASVEEGLRLAPVPAPYLEATGAVIRGRVAAAQGAMADARARYREAIFALAGAGSDHDVAQLWFELANLLADVGDHEGAVEAFRSAGVSTGLRMQPATRESNPAT